MLQEQARSSVASSRTLIASRDLRDRVAVVSGVHHEGARRCQIRAGEDLGMFVAHPRSKVGIR